VTDKPTQSGEVLQFPSAPRVPYEAFRKGKPRTNVNISTKDTDAYTLRYSAIFNIVVDQDTYTSIVLFTQVMAVEIKGKHLSAVHQALTSDTCEFMQEFTPAKFIAPDDATAPLIESVEVHFRAVR
jgi:hypothetical protein